MWAIYKKVMKLHIFNPEHDIALASDMFNFVAPHAGREMRSDLGFLPALWAEDGDMVLVDDIASALSRVRHLGRYTHDVAFVTYQDLKHLPPLEEICPWGWDRSLRFQLERNGIAKELLPTEAYLDSIRAMSHRWWAGQNLLKKLTETNDERVGSSRLIDNINQLDDIGYTYVMKAPWSSSGRGLRYVDQLTSHQRGWAKNVIARQGALTLEPYYRKIKDFAVELYAYPDRIEYLGLSVFQSSNGSYVGNILASEEEKVEIISKYIPFYRVQSAIDELCAILTDEMVGKYAGPLGVDMMIVDENGIKLHPCVELNLRRTMGHVALSFNQTQTDPRKLMQISYSRGYHFRVLTTAENCYPSVW